MTSPGDGFRLLSKSGVFVRCAVEGWGVARRPDVLLAMLPLLLFEWGALAWVASFPHPPWGDPWGPLYRAIGGDAALHYPGSWGSLPLAFAWLDRVVVWLVGSFAFAGTIALMPGAFLGQPFDGRTAIRIGAARGAAVLAASLPVLVIGGAAGIAAQRAGDTVLSAAPGLPIGSMFSLALTALEGGVRCFLVYVAVAIVRDGPGPLTAVRRSVTFASHHFWTTAGLLIGAALPANLLRAYRGDPSARFGDESPETVLLWVGAEVFLAWLGWIVAIGATTRLWLHFEGIAGVAGTTGRAGPTDPAIDGGEGA